MTAPSEQEIREAIAVRGTYSMASSYSGGLRGALEGLISEYAEAIDSAVSDAEAARDDVLEEGQDPRDLAGLWADLRLSEADRLRRLADAATARAADRAEAIIVEEIVAAGLAFAAEFPDAPRGRQEAVAVA